MLPIRIFEEIKSVSINISENKASAFRLFFLGHSGILSVALPDTASCLEYGTGGSKKGSNIVDQLRKICR